MPPSRLSADERSGRSPSQTADQSEIAHELARLETLDLTQLRVQFRNRTGRIAPARISGPLLLRLIGYRMQAERFGDLPPDTKRFLDRLASAAAASSLDAPRADDRASVAAAEGRMRLRTGTVLVREWQGRLEQVRVLPDGFGWNGSTYASLSAVASAMTGTRWNGHRFFGLGQNGKAAQARGAGHNKAAQAAKAAQARKDVTFAGKISGASTASFGMAGAAVEAAPLRDTSCIDEVGPPDTAGQSSAASLTGTVTHVGMAVRGEFAPIGMAAAITPTHASARAIA